MWPRAWLPGRGVCDVAEKYGLIARHLSQWRGLARKGKLVLPADGAPSFVPLVVEPVAVPGPDIMQTDYAVLRVEIAGAVLHVAPDCSLERAAALNRTIKDATIKHFHYDSHDQLRTHLADFLAAYNFARRAKTLNGFTPYEYIAKYRHQSWIVSSATRSTRCRD